MNAQSLFQLLLSGEQWGHAKVFNVNELLWLMMMTQSLRYLFIEPIDHLHHQFVNLSTSQSDILPSCVPPSTDWHIAHLWQSFCPPRAQSDILPSFGMQSFFSGFLLCPTNPLSTESMIKVQATPLLQYVPPDVDPPASYVCNPSQNGQTVTELDRNLIHGRISFFNKKNVADIRNLRGRLHFTVGIELGPNLATAS